MVHFGKATGESMWKMPPDMKLKKRKEEEQALKRKQVCAGCLKTNEEGVF